MVSHHLQQQTASAALKHAPGPHERDGIVTENLAVLSAVPIMVSQAMPSRHSAQAAADRDTVGLRVIWGSETAMHASRRPSRAREQRRRGLSPRQLQRAIGGSGDPRLTWEPGTRPDGSGVGGKEEEEKTAPPAAPVPWLNCSRGASRRADALLPAGVARSRPASARARAGVEARRRRRQQQQHQQQLARAAAAAAAAAEVTLNEPSLTGPSLATPRPPPSYRAGLGISPGVWRDKATPRPKPVEVGEEEVVLVVGPERPKAGPRRQAREGWPAEAGYAVPGRRYRPYL